MAPPVDFQNLTPEKLRRFMDRHIESSYRLVDVRQPDEYEAAHIPGARLLPLPELEARLYAAFDLYRTMAERAENPLAKSTFLDIAQAEKGHMNTLSRAIIHCRKIG